MVETPAERQAAFDLRVAVFVGEQGISVEEELDELDARAVHAIAVHDGSGSWDGAVGHDRRQHS